MPPIRCENGSWARDNKQKADLFADYLADIFQPNEIQTNHNLELENNTNEEKIPLVTPKEVAEKIKINLNPRKAPGFELITGMVLK